ncbi:MAG: serine hydrolase [Candidatus Baltobacteraceae bacterium]
MVTSTDFERLAGACGLRQAAVLLRALDGPRPGADVIWGDPDREIYPASMLKTPLALAVFALADDGVLSLEAPVSVTADNMTQNDKPSPLVPGYRAHVGELIELAITRSDNVATNILYDLAGRKRASGILRERFALGATAFRRKLSGAEPLIPDPQWDGVLMNRHSLRDAARVFELIARDAVPHAAELRELLSRQEWNTKLSRGLQPGDRFAHKTGDTDEVAHDGGILQLCDGRSFVLVVYTATPSSDAHDARFGDFMRSVRILI